jgi:hypothetical protein
MSTNIEVAAEVPIADSFEAFTCADCPGVHFMLFDEDGYAFATMVLTQDQLEKVLHLLAPVTETVQ